MLAVPDEQVLERFNVDIRLVTPEKPDAFKALTTDAGEEKKIDEWGVVYQKDEFAQTHFIVTSESPLRKAASIQDIKSHKWPQIPTTMNYAGLREQAKQHHENGFGVVLSTPLLVMTLAQSLRGQVQFLEDTVVNQKLLCYLLDTLLEMQLEKARLLISEVSPYVDVVTMGDDLSHQTSLFYHPDQYRKLFKPLHRKIAAFLKSEANEAKILYHCCGAVEPLIKDLIEIGVEALNPVQVNAKGMEDTKKLKALYGKDLVFWGGIDTQQVLPFGSPEDVQHEVRRRIDDLSTDGGYIMAAVHNIRPEVSPENICSMFDTAMEYGSS